MFSLCRSERKDRRIDSLRESRKGFTILLIVMSLAAKYRKSKEKRCCLRFKTVHPDGDDFDGVVTHIKQRFVVLREERGFVFDGLVLLPKRVIKGWRDGRFERCTNKINSPARHPGAASRTSLARFLRSHFRRFGEATTSGCLAAVEMLVDDGAKIDLIPWPNC